MFKYCKKSFLNIIINVKITCSNYITQTKHCQNKFINFLIINTSIYFIFLPKPIPRIFIFNFSNKPYPSNNNSHKYNHLTSLESLKQPNSKKKKSYLINKIFTR
ncbi:hypothetical protein V8G54_013043, partial [Vigna mungo]